MNNKKIWIVDDDKSIRWVLEKALQSNDIDIQTFSQPDAVLKRMDDTYNSTQDKDFLIQLILTSCNFFTKMRHLWKLRCCLNL